VLVLNISMTLSFDLNINRGHLLVITNLLAW